MIIFTFDGTFEGLLTSIYEAYYSSQKPDKICPCNKVVYNLIDIQLYIETDNLKAEKVFNAIKKKISSLSLTYIFYVFLSELPDCNSLIYNYVKLGFKVGSNINLYLHDDTVLQVHKIYNKVSKEAHLMLGFVRFKEINNNYYYSAIEPAFNICTLIADHFINRLPAQNWIIHDINREIAILYNTKKWILYTLTKEQGLNIYNSSANSLYETLWRDYYKSATITSRENPKYQKRSMPKKYWGFLTELK